MIGTVDKHVHYQLAKQYFVNILKVKRIRLSKINSKQIKTSIFVTNSI